MGILGALSTAVTGLSAQSYALENISGNIANSQTVGFKRVDTSFVDLIPDSPPGSEISGSVVSYSACSNTLQGTLDADRHPDQHGAVRQRLLRGRQERRLDRQPELLGHQPVHPPRRLQDRQQRLPRERRRTATSSGTRTIRPAAP